MRFYWYVSIVKIILYAVLGLISFMIIVPKLNISWIDDIPLSINKLFVNLPTQEKLLWILLVVVVYLILLVLIKYRDVYILFILSNIFVIYFSYQFLVSLFKLNTIWNIILTIIISLVVIGIRLAIFEKVRDIIEPIKEVISNFILKKIKNGNVENKK